MDYTNWNHYQRKRLHKARLARLRQKLQKAHAVEKLDEVVRGHVSWNRRFGEAVRIRSGAV